MGTEPSVHLIWQGLHNLTDPEIGERGVKKSLGGGAGGVHMAY